MFGPVFTKEPDLREDLTELLKMMLCEGGRDAGSEWVEEIMRYNDWVDQIKSVQSNMKVSEWVTTPWHYETLPWPPNRS